MFLRCFDGVTFEAIPAGDLVLGYVDGDYQTWGPLNERFKGSETRVVSVTVDVKPGADIADCERGNAGPDAVAAWAKAELHERRRPTIYGSADWLDECVLALRKLRINRSLVDWFLADYVQVAPELGNVDWNRPIEPGYVAWQFADSIPYEGHTIDASLVTQSWAIRHGWVPLKAHKAEGMYFPSGASGLTGMIKSPYA